VDVTTRNAEQCGAEALMSTTARVCGWCLAAVVSTLSVSPALAQDPSPEALVQALRRGGYVFLMRHASSPSEPPSAQTANADNPKLERQLDEAGRTSARAMGNALRALKIPIGAVLTSPTYRALETVRYANLPNPQLHPELGDGGQSMKTATDAQGTWLRQRAAILSKGSNTVIVTHMPNLARAFPEVGSVADGETIVMGPDGKNGVRPVGRIRIDDWPRLHNTP
jgi:phosphohistidine phosphatase SixA